MKRRVTLVEKGGMFGLLSLEKTSETTILTNYDPRGPTKYFRAFGDPDEAQRFFEESVATTRDHGWKVVWNGTPNWG